MSELHWGSKVVVIVALSTAQTQVGSTSILLNVATVTNRALHGTVRSPKVEAAYIQ